MSINVSLLYEDALPKLFIHNKDNVTNHLYLCSHGFVRQKLLLTAPDFNLFFILVQIFFFKLIIVSSLYLRTLYMEGHMKLDTDKLCRYLSLFNRPILYLFVRHKEKLAKENRISEKSHLFSVSKFWYYGNH